MKIPRKISPDNLRDTIVQVLFNTSLAHELILGEYNIALSNSFKFIGAPTKPQQAILSTNQKLVVENVGRGYFLDHAERVKIDVRPEGISFNCYKQYIGWDEYFIIISSTLKILYDKGWVNEINRIGLRYISEFENVNLTKSLNLHLEISLPNTSFENTQVRSEYTDEDFKAVVTLINEVPKPQSDAKVSIIDIDIIKFSNEKVSLDSLLNVIERAHFKQKATFFSLLKSDFLNTLNPVY
jgi:uncharacterized protein (TIGR04255 family)